MAALTFHNSFYSDPSLINPQFQSFSPELSPDLICLPPPHLVPDPTFDYLPNFTPFFDDPSSCFFPDICPYFTDPIAEQFPPVSADFFPFDEFQLHCPKRQRLLPEHCFCSGPPPEMFTGLWDGIVDNAEIMSNGSCSKAAPSVSPSNNLSAQTIAARERRRKITAKTQELGELVPGGSKMNTAEMLNSAFKYVKFLQAQVAILQFKQDTEQTTEQELQETENLKILESSMIQEKLYSEEQCLVPKGFVQNLANFPEIQSHPSIFNSVNEILQKGS